MNSTATAPLLEFFARKKYQTLFRLTTSWLPAFLHRHRGVLLGLFNCAALALGCLLLAGCSAPNILAGIYLVAFSLPASDTTAGFSHLEIRLGYFFLCARSSTSSSWTCGDPDQVIERLRDADEPWNLGKTAYDLRDQAVSPSLL
jgi:hypothetical protein